MARVYGEVWNRPGHPTFGRVIDYLPVSVHTIHDGLNIIGDGSMSLPDTFGRLSEIVWLDVLVPSDSEASTVRLFTDDDPLFPFFEWLPSARLPTTGKDDPTVEVSGDGIKSLVSHARVEAFDWDGSPDFKPTFPDWTYGGPNILRNPGFELSGVRAYIYSLWNDATGGTFTLTWDGQTTAAIAFNASSTDINNALENLSNVDDVLVAGTGTEADPWRVEFVDPPFPDNNGLSCNGASLTGTTEGCVVDTIQVGTGEIADAWERSQRADRRSTPALHGCPSIFRRSSGAEPVLYGEHSLVIAGSCQYTGGQQVLSVTPGGTYQANIWVNSNTAAQSFRLVLRDRYERILVTAAGTEAFVEVTPAADTWTELRITDVLMNLYDASQPGNVGEPVSEVVFRFANITPSPAGIWYWDMEDDGTQGLTVGLAAATIGQILTDLYDDAVTDHAADGRIVWEDEANPGTPYLTLDFTPTLDSAGDPWDRDDLTVKLWMRMRYDQVMSQAASTWGYEWRIVPDDVEAGTWLWQVYNPKTMMVDHTTAASPAIQGGSDDTRRLIRIILPSTDPLVEGEDSLTGRAANPGLRTALGRIESSRLDRQLPSADAVTSAVGEDADSLILDGIAVVYALSEPEEIPLTAYQIGDLLVVHDPPDIDLEARFVELSATFTPRSEEWETSWSPENVGSS